MNCKHIEMLTSDKNLHIDIVLVNQCIFTEKEVSLIMWLIMNHDLIFSDTTFE